MLGSRHIPWVALSIVAVGCDPVKTTLQSVHLRVVHATSGEPVVGAQVLLKYDFETAEPISQERRQPPEEWHQHMARFWNDFPWFAAVTDNHGEAAIGIQYTGIDRNRRSKPAATGHRGTPYLIRVMDGQLLEEEVGLLMTSGETASGTAFTITVIDVQEPKYVETHK